MPRSGPAKYTPEELEAAVKAVQVGKLNQTMAASKYNIPKSTLNDKLLGKNNRSILGVPVNTATQKKQFKDFCAKEYLTSDDQITETISCSQGEKIVQFLQAGTADNLDIEFVQSKDFKLISDTKKKTFNELYITEDGKDKKVIFVEEFYDVISKSHTTKEEHHSLAKTMSMLNEKYYGIPPEAVQRFVENCPACRLTQSQKKSSSRTFNPANCPLIPMRQFPNKAHSSVRVGGTEMNFTPALCMDAECANTEAQHYHCPLCPVTESFLESKKVSNHYFVKHLTGVCADFSGMVMLRCYDYCFCIRSPPHVLLFGTAHYHCFGCGDGFKTKSNAIRHYRSHINKAQGSIQVRVSDDINSDCPMRPSEVLKAEWLEESERLALKGQMEGTEQVDESDVLASQSESQDISSFLSATESSAENTLNSEMWHDEASNDTEDPHGLHDEMYEDEENSLNEDDVNEHDESMEDLREQMKERNKTISEQKKQIAMYEEALDGKETGNPAMKNVAFTQKLQSLMADIQQKHMAMMQRHREEMEDFMDEQLNRISQAVLHDREEETGKPPEKDSTTKSKRGRPTKKSVTLPPAPSPSKNKTNQSKKTPKKEEYMVKPVTSTPLPGYIDTPETIENGVDDTEDHIKKEKEITEESGKRKSGRKRVNQKSALELLELTPRTKRQHRASDDT